MLFWNRFASLAGPETQTNKVIFEDDISVFFACLWTAFRYDRQSLKMKPILSFI
jgi:hypothetical protein